jgi:hypothetical protein
MRRAIIAGLLSVGLFAGCGGVEPESRDVEALGPTPCEAACIALYKGCMRQAPVDPDACLLEQRDCYNGCAGAVAPEASHTEQALNCTKNYQYYYFSDATYTQQVGDEACACGYNVSLLGFRTQYKLVEWESRCR